MSAAVAFAASSSFTESSCIFASSVAASFSACVTDDSFVVLAASFAITDTDASSNADNTSFLLIEYEYILSSGPQHKFYA